MANPDHTARARPSQRSAPSYRPLFPLSAAKAKRQTPVTKLAGTALAGLVIREVLDDSKAAHRAQAKGRQPPAGRWPLSPVQTNGLQAALFFLRQYADTLKSDRDG